MAQPNRWMLFVDGENLTIRAQRIADRKGIALLPGAHWMKDVFIWLPGVDPVTQVFMLRFPHSLHIPFQLENRSMRSYYYTALRASQDAVDEVRQSLRKLSFEPRIFKKSEDRSKGVDISLATDVLSHAFRDNFDLAVLIAGDADYVPLVEELKRLGRIVCVYFFRDDVGGFSPDLQVAADFRGFIDDPVFEAWTEWVRKHPVVPAERTGD